MKAIQFEKAGGPEVLVLREVATPRPGPGQALVRLAAAGVNFIDTYHRSGLYNVSLPFTPGLEGAGVVEALGEGVSSPQVGDRVAYTNVQGSYAEYIVVPAQSLIRLPEAVAFDIAAGVMLQGITAHYLVNSTFPLAAGNVCLVHAGAGGVGLLLIQMAKRKGATVITTVGTREKGEIARGAGADHVIFYREVDFAKETRTITHGAGVDVVYDSVGQETFEKSLDSLKPRGMMVSFGNSSGKVTGVEPLLLMRKGSLFLTRPTIDHYIPDRATLEKRANDVLQMAGSGLLNVRIGHEYPLAEAAQAHRDLEARRTTGKVILKVS